MAKRHDPEEYAKLEVRPSHQFFFLNGELHKITHTSRATSTVYTWNFKQHREVAYPIADVERNRQPAWSIPEAAKIVARHVKTVRKVLWTNTVIEPPQYSYKTPGPWTRKTGHWLSSDDIMELRDHYASKTHAPRAHRSGRHVNNITPSREEVRAKLTNSTVTYVKKDGKFVPVWKA